MTDRPQVISFNLYVWIVYVDSILLNSVRDGIVRWNVFQ